MNPDGAAGQGAVLWGLRCRISGAPTSIQLRTTGMTAPPRTLQSVLPRYGYSAGMLDPHFRLDLPGRAIDSHEPGPSVSRQWHPCSPRAVAGEVTLPDRPWGNLEPELGARGDRPRPVVAGLPPDRDETLEHGRSSLS